MDVPKQQGSLAVNESLQLVNYRKLLIKHGFANIFAIFTATSIQYYE